MKNIKKEQSLVIIKPDGIQRSLIGEIIKRYEKTGLKLIAIKMFVPSVSLIEKHYLIDPQWPINVGTKALASYKNKGQKPPSNDPKKIGMLVLSHLKKYLSAGPVIAMTWQGMHAVSVIRKITGSTEPCTSDVGTIRGDYTIDSYQISDVDNRSVRNLVHASGSPQEAEKEIPLWFKPREIINYRLINEEILYDVNLDGILE